MRSWVLVMLRRRVVVLMESPPASSGARACVPEARTYRVTDAVSIGTADHDHRPRARRRSPESAEREILDAAESFLAERPFRDLSVDEVMARTTMSRPSFYVYFRDRHHLLVRLVEGIGRELFDGANIWLAGDGDPRASLSAPSQRCTPSTASCWARSPMLPVTTRTPSRPTGA